MAGTQKRDAKRAEIAERQRKALDLRLRGATYDQIATALGYSHRSNARKDIEEALASLERECAESAKRVRQKELLKLDMIELGLAKRTYAGDDKAVDRALRIMERRAALLGLDAPKKTQAEVTQDVTVTEAVHDQLLARLARLVAGSGAGEGDPEPERDGGD